MKILVVDDDSAISAGLKRWLESDGHAVTVLYTAEDAFNLLELESHDLVISDVTMPGMDGYELCRKVRERYPKSVIPIILITGNHPFDERILGLEAGADDFLTKPLSKGELFARVRSLLRIKRMHDTITTQAAQLALLNKALEEKIKAQINQLTQLKRFFSPQIANLLTSGNGGDPLKSHRSEVTVVFIDLRGFTSFAEMAEPEEVIALLNEYYTVVGSEALKFKGTLGHYAGDGIMVFFNDPLEVRDHVAQALKMAMAARESLQAMKKTLSDKGYKLDFGAGISTGFANIGILGFESLWDYTVIGTVTNLAARLCAEAKGGQILLSQRLHSLLGDPGIAKLVGPMNFKGISRPIIVYAVEYEQHDSNEKKSAA